MFISFLVVSLKIDTTLISLVSDKYEAGARRPLARGNSLALSKGNKSGSTSKAHKLTITSCLCKYKNNNVLFYEGLCAGLFFFRKPHKSITLEVLLGRLF